jgi:hypothetical protein
MANEYLTFQKFSDPGLALAIAEKLQENNIDFLIEDNSKLFNPSFITDAVAASINLKVKGDDFEKAEKALEELYKKDLDDVEKDYDLFSFSDDELKSIIEKSDEWGQLDFQLAQKILKERGKEINPQEIELLKFRRINDLAEPESTNHTWIVLAYLFSLVACVYTILGGFVGILLGWSLSYLKKPLPDGQLVYAYNEAVRKQGRFLLLFSIAVTCLSYAIRVYFYHL